MVELQALLHITSPVSSFIVFKAFDLATVRFGEKKKKTQIKGESLRFQSVEFLFYITVLKDFTSGVV